MRNTILKMTLSASVVTVLAGCASAPTPEPYRDVEPALVGIPMTERIASSAKRINAQFELLNKVRANEYVGKYDMPVHNQEVDARIGSKNTLPQSYANKDEIIAKALAEQKERDLLAAKKSQVIKKIDWQNSSLNDLVKNFSSALDYNVVYVSKTKDLNVNYKVENETLESALNRLANEVKPIALLTIDDANKTIFLNYN